jgi:hypothetical protein
MIEWRSPERNKDIVNGEEGSKEGDKESGQEGIKANREHCVEGRFVI